MSLNIVSVLKLLELIESGFDDHDFTKIVFNNVRFGSKIHLLISSNNFQYNFPIFKHITEWLIIGPCFNFGNESQLMLIEI